jgi:hypothetical protein
MPPKISSFRFVFQGNCRLVVTTITQKDNRLRRRVWDLKHSCQEITEKLVGKRNWISALLVMTPEGVTIHA